MDSPFYLRPSLQAEKDPPPGRQPEQGEEHEPIVSYSDDEGRLDAAGKEECDVQIIYIPFALTQQPQPQQEQEEVLLQPASPKQPPPPPVGQEFLVEGRARREAIPLGHALILEGKEEYCLRSQFLDDDDDAQN